MKQTLIDLCMPEPLIGFFARPYIGGYSLEEVTHCVQDLYQKRRILSSVDVLGEEAHSEEKTLYYRQLYFQLMDAVSQFPYERPEHKPSISLKLSALTVMKSREPELILDRPLLENNLAAILSHAQKKVLKVTIDMEDHHWTDFTLEIYQQFLRQGYHSLGTVLQTCLHRTESDIEHLDDNARVRLCIGIYREPTELALTDKPSMKERMLTFSKRLLEKGVFTEFATHDTALLHHFFDEVLTPRLGLTNQVECQMLLGVPRESVQSQIQTGNYRTGVPALPIRLYVPFAETRSDAITYCKRRLMANPSILSYGVHNLFSQLTGQS